MLIQASKQYDFDRVHSRLSEAFFADFIIWSVGHAAPLATHYGDIAGTYEMIDRGRAVLQRKILDSPQRAETVHRDFGLITLPRYAMLAHLCNLPVEQKSLSCALLSAFGLSWAAAATTVDAVTESSPNIRKRGRTEQGQFWSAEQWEWFAKCAFWLCAAEPGVSRDEVAASLPSISAIVDMQSCPGADVMSNWTFCNLFVSVACVWESLGRHDSALRYATAALENDMIHSGTVIPCARISAYCIQGRTRAALGHTKAAAIAFEAAVELADKHELWLLLALALKDFKRCILDGQSHADHASRRLGEALRLLKGPADMLVPLMDGIAVAELIRMAPPDAGYELVYEEEDTALTSLRQELKSLRLKELRKRAKDEGVPEDVLEDAIDEDNPKAALIDLLVERHAVDMVEDQDLRAELERMRLKDLRARATHAGIDQDDVDDAIDSDDPKGTLIALIVRASTSSASSTKQLLTPLADGEAGVLDHLRNGDADQREQAYTELEAAVARRDTALLHGGTPRCCVLAFHLCMRCCVSMPRWSIPLSVSGCVCC
jgi:hypothetical protein